MTKQQFSQDEKVTIMEEKVVNKKKKKKELVIKPMSEQEFTPVTSEK